MPFLIRLLSFILLILIVFIYSPTGVKAFSFNEIPQVTTNFFSNVLGLFGFVSAEESPLQVLAADTSLDTSSLLKGTLNINIPSQFNASLNGVTIATKDLQVSGTAVFGEGLTAGQLSATEITADTLTLSGSFIAPNVLYSVSSGDGISVSSGQNPKISNTGVLSLAGKTGVLSLSAGSGISVSGLEVTNSDKGSSQNIFKTITVGSTSFSAGTNTDTLTFASGTGVNLAIDTTNKKLTFSSTGGAAAWSTGTGTIYPTTITDSIGIGTTTPSYLLDVAGTGRFTSQLLLTGSPSSSAAGGGSLYINPASATADYTLFGVSVGGTEKLRIDAEGDIHIQGSIISTTPGTVGYWSRASTNTYLGNSGDLVGIGTSAPAAGIEVTKNGAASLSGGLYSGTWYTGGTATTTKPQLLIEPTGTTSTGWSTSGTGLGVNSASGFVGNLLDLQRGGAASASISYSGQLTLNGTDGLQGSGILFKMNGTQTAFLNANVGGGIGVSASGQSSTIFLVPGYTDAYIKGYGGANTRLRFQSHNGTAYQDAITLYNGNVGIGITAPVAGLENATAGAASKANTLLSGTWFTGGTATTTKPQLLIEPTGTTSTGWSTAGTGLGVNSPSGFTGKIVDFQLNGATLFNVNASGRVIIRDSLAPTTTTPKGLISLEGGAGGQSPCIGFSHAGTNYNYLCGAESNGVLGLASGSEGTVLQISSVYNGALGLTATAGSPANSRNLTMNVTGGSISSEALAFQVAATTATLTGGYATQRFIQIGQSTITAASALSISSEASTINIAGPPISAGSATIANAYGLKIDSGTSVAAGVTNAYGLYVAAPTGATNNYAATFATGNVGIGTTSPKGNLHSYGTIVLNNGNYFQAYDTSQDSTRNVFTVGSGTASVQFTEDIMLTSASRGLYWRIGGNTLGGILGTTNGNGVNVQGAARSGGEQTLVITPAAHTAITAEVNDISVAAHTNTITGGYATQRFSLFNQPTITAASALTVTDTATLAIAGAPIKAGSAVLTNTHGLLIQAGAVSTAVNSYGLTVNAQTGATNNYTAAFLGGNVGIGTTTPGMKLSFGTSVPNAKRIIGIYETGNSGSGIGMDAADSSMRIYADTAQTRLLNIGTYTTDGAYTWSPKVTVDIAGNVGIGTTAPVAGLENASAGAASKPGGLLSGTWFTGGTATTTKPQLLVEPTGTTSTGWSTSGTGLGINAASGFTGNLIDAQVNGTTYFRVSSGGIKIGFGQGTLNVGGASDWTVSGSNWSWGSNMVVSQVSADLNVTYRTQNKTTFDGVNQSSVIAEKTTWAWSPPTLTITGGYANQRFWLMNQPTITAASALNISSEASTLNIVGAPISAGSATIANAYGIKVDSGTSVAAGVTNAYGLAVAAPTGATNNYAAIFTGGNVGIGTTNPQQRLVSLATTEQLRLAYDASNYSSFTVSSGGNLTLTPSGGTINFSGTYFNPASGANRYLGQDITTTWYAAHIARLRDVSGLTVLDIQNSADSAVWLTNTWGPPYTGGQKPLLLGHTSTVNTTGLGLIEIGLPANGANYSITAEAPSVALTGRTMTISGGYATQRFNYIEQSTITAASALNISTQATTLSIAGPPISAGSATIANAYGIKVDSGTSVAAGVTNAYGLAVAAPTGATNNYAAIFTGGNVGVGTTAPVAGLENATVGAASKANTLLSGTWFTGGSATTTKPQLLIEPTGTTSTGWSTSGTGLGINAATGHAGPLIDAQLNGISQFQVWSSSRATNSGPVVAILGGAISGGNFPGLGSISGDLTIGAAANSDLRILNPLGGSGTTRIQQRTSIEPPAKSGGVISFTITPGAHTAIISEVNDILVSAHTNTITGGYATQRFSLFNQPTITAASALNISSEATTLSISGAPISAGSATITNAYGLKIDSGTSVAAGVTNAYGLAVATPTGATNNYAAIFTGGNVGVGTTAPVAPFEVKASGTGVIAKFTSTNTTGCTLADGGTISCTSDRNFKKNIESLPYGLDTLMALHPVEFNWNSQTDGSIKNLGFIAQEVETVVPNLVRTDLSNGQKQLNTIGIVPILAKSIQQQQVQIKNNESRMTNLESRILGLESQTSTSSANSDPSWLDIVTKAATASADPSFTIHHSSFESLQTTDATISGTLKSLGDTFLGNTTVAGNFSIDGTTSLTGNSLNSIGCSEQLGMTQTDRNSGGSELQSLSESFRNCGILYIQSSPLATLVDFFNGQVKITKEGVVKAKTLEVENLKISSATIGSGVIEAGQTSVTIDTTEIHKGSNVFVTPVTITDKVLAVVRVVDGKSFDVAVKTPDTQNIKFNWWIVDTY